jgi:hypothetical protein
MYLPAIFLSIHGKIFQFCNKELILADIGGDVFILNEAR